eukprot:12764176-Prorocentrum_lima.AAC.1
MLFLYVGLVLGHNHPLIAVVGKGFWSSRSVPCLVVHGGAESFEHFQDVAALPYKVGALFHVIDLG